MSTRTILEINHDHLGHLQKHPEIFAEILAELGMSIHGAALNKANERGHALDIGHGVRIVLQRHHSTDVTVQTDYAGVRL
ncbi:hypothetical protein B0G76_1293 [Paraburkholderia sp. BL23I1N1]|uniref:hypothetical protein n=1 Tax=Paraburkholderia sp. BL23I1N1 TaxID=1938802 RepID=UPI000E723720|nr:hypothetical protein [Paraburkholderia sp. BL23I1N1]RKE35232.1 hypothetical protein B0G76_1293 [Paraburkholderia sp. BL23I1N1]